MNDIYKKIQQINRDFKSASKIKSVLKEEKNKINIFNRYFNISFNSDIKVKSLYKVYPNGVQAITNINLNISPGEFVVFLGPSGCGKTTLLRMIAGLEDVTQGLLLSNDDLLNNKAPGMRGLSMVFQNYALYPYMSVYENIAFGLKIKTKKNQTILQIKEFMRLKKNPYYYEIKNAKADIKFIKYPKLKEIFELKNKALFETNMFIRVYKLFLLSNRHFLYLLFYYIMKKNKLGDLKEVENVKKIKKEHKLYKDKNKHEIKNAIKEARVAKSKFIKLWKQTIDSRIQNATKIIGINQFLRRKPADLSGGQRQRVALSRAITKQSKIYLFDEPLSNLDAKLRAKMRSEIRMLHDKLGATTVYVTHDQIEAMTMADKVVVMNEGFIMQIDSPKKLFEAPNSVFVAKFVGTPEMNIFDGEWNGDKIKVGNVMLNISKSVLMEKLKKGTKVKVGIRPHDILSNDLIVSNSKTNVFESNIFKEELMGDSYIINAKLDSVNLRLISSSYEISTNKEKKIKYFINPNKIHLFDFETGINLTNPIDEVNRRVIEIWNSSKEDRIKNNLLIWREKNKESLAKRLYKKIKMRVNKKFKFEEKKRISNEIKNIKNNS